MPQLAAFPKAWLDDLCLSDKMTIRQWIDLGASLDLDGLEFYTGFRELADPKMWPESRRIAEDRGVSIPMLCCSPDFTHPDPPFRQKQVEADAGHRDVFNAHRSQVGQHGYRELALGFRRDGESGRSPAVVRLGQGNHLFKHRERSCPLL